MDYFILIFEIAVLIFQIAVLTTIAGHLLRRGAPYVPSSKKAAEVIANAFPLPTNAVLYDLGSGDGRILRAFAKRYPSARYFGIERDLSVYLLAKFLSRKFKNIRFKRGSFFIEDLSDAGCVFAYLFPEVLDALLPKLQKELKPGTIFLSLDFKFQHKQFAQKIDVVPSARLCRVLYLYKF